MAGFGQYLKDTRGELRHVAWPTRTQTVVYTILVALISIGVALYLGLFDFLFTTGLARLVEVLPSASPIQVTQQPVTTTPTVNFSVPTTTSQ
ncbi:preprotein translocase subunit SecE [Candidatus Kaiserbacteria bacterium RIFCSPHIGHO2_02_FULL_55_25]|uniref:Protein translocase subunit SecE n=1 Tax=Candidatus Kaiserbacteria bacterium RIFCSPHIGHO2_02_FULL_55_25 TaxID=1798498 RepID=A0A1F6E536_9BACT|nr:MAG: preprotein translocase subunit SecE [Candidatus Kaiserbacteria bacterium RIFCSPHIGHO2_01_FULL_55_79]OGG68799.1 MAG: preprotein translocase subunit SecE [Candidatus Kaiserbacteria bacterium RIFCSPHIGHO2_02_FULL_55_25]OGG77274.1 MAG: preprotein translocase subunit SecE [Candidatus Kaiserbacteria bacterium RIFCSPHIGHO2_12_FULL_55_13]OGG82969.1 MAG: preprotein translocase subunit SecE [Candidatus Kaiserbacteria bacterium RIFCSPLOWO2_01_FULL_55_25]